MSLDIIQTLSESERSEFAERAAILEYEAGYTRAAAEAIVKSWILHTREIDACKLADAVRKHFGIIDQ